ncbi:MAG: S-layer homology domain-containing protein [Firmicutes bacterium]|nr:S-layer homology domain-containing protein [Bacillota bacterium]
MKRKLLSFAIAFALLSQTLVSAGALTTSLGSATTLPLQPSSGVVSTTVKGEVKGAGESYSTSTTQQTFDYRASIDMSNVLSKFNTFYGIGNDMTSSTFTTDYANSVVTGQFDVTFTLTPGISTATTTLAALALPSTSIFKIISKVPDTTVSPNTLVVTAEVVDPATGLPGLTVSDLNTNKSTYLADFYLDIDSLSASVKNSSITVSMAGYVEIGETDEPGNPYAKINFNSNTAPVTVYVGSSGGGGGVAPSNAPTANADSGDSVVGINVTKVGSNYYVDSSDLPKGDEAGNAIYGWYLDKDCTIPVTFDNNGRAKISGNTIFYSRTTPIASTVVDNVTDSVVVNSNGDGTFTVDMTTLPTQDNNGHTIYGWDLDEDHTTPAKPGANGVLEITSDTLLYPRTSPIAFTVIGKQIDSVPISKVADGIFTIDVDKIDEPSKDGFVFFGWYTEPNFINPLSGTANITKDTYLYPRYVNITPPEQMISEEHILYVYGYPDGEVKPNGYITREEVAAIFYRLLKPEYRATIETDENSFPDVESGRWSNHEISTMANGGYIVGDENGYFNPANPIKRAEFTVIASKFAPVDAEVAENYFTDIEGHWAKEFILKIAGQYWISGNPDGTFNPDAPITRAEAMTIINRMLVRYGDHESDYATQWPDVDRSDWYYDSVIEATTHNAYVRTENGWSEVWIGDEEVE